MAEYIEREAALRIVDRRVDLNEKTKHVFQALTSLPAADVAPVMHGRWIDTGEKDTDGNAWFVCNICGHRDLHAPLMDVPHCWFCGAKMNGGIKRFRDVEDAAMDKLRKKFADKDRTGFCEIVAAVEAEMDGKKPEVPKTPETPEVPEKKPAGKKGGK